jgi:hypothetical protein
VTPRGDEPKVASKLIKQRMPISILRRYLIRWIGGDEENDLSTVIGSGTRIGFKRYKPYSLMVHPWSAVSQHSSVGL